VVALVATLGSVALWVAVGGMVAADYRRERRRFTLPALLVVVVTVGVLAVVAAPGLAVLS
jgi:peptidoglycan/LPS O-acetylase OafA/YrhL